MEMLIRKRENGKGMEKSKRVQIVGRPWRHGMVWAEHPGRRPRCNSNKIVAFEQTGKLHSPSFFFKSFSLFFPKKIIGVCLFGWHACHYHCQVLKSTQVRILESAEDDSNSLKEFWIWTLRTLCYSTQFESAKSFQFKGFSLKISCSVVWGKAERDGFWGEGEVHQGETIKRVPRM